jgi:hypothetical protein
MEESAVRTAPVTKLGTAIPNYLNVGRDGGIGLFSYLNILTTAWELGSDLALLEIVALSFIFFF